MKTLSFKNKYATLSGRYESLALSVRDYIKALKSMKAQTAGVFPAYGKQGEENIAGKSAPNVVFVKDLINQVLTADALGYNTHLQSNGTELSVVFVEKTPRIPVTIEYL